MVQGNGGAAVRNLRPLLPQPFDQNEEKLTGVLIHRSLGPASSGADFARRKKRMRMKSLLLTVLLFAAVVPGAFAQVNPQVFTEVPVDVLVSGVGFDQYGIQLTVTRGSFSCGGTQW